MRRGVKQQKEEMYDRKRSRIEGKKKKRRKIL